MASLIKQNGFYYSQFYDKSRSPNRKRVALKTKSRDVATKLHRQLEDEYAMGTYDPWTGYSHSGRTTGLQKHSTVREAVRAYVEQKSLEDWRSNTRTNTEYVLRAFARQVGEQASLQEITPQAINGYLNQQYLAYETKKSHKSKVKPFANWLKKNGLVNFDYSLVKIYNNDTEQEEVISYLSASEIETLQQGIREKVAHDLKLGYQKADRNSLWLIDFIDWQRYSGMRISETLSLTPRSINTETWQLTIGSNTFTTKSKRKQMLPIRDVAILREIATRLLNNCSNAEDRLFGHKDRRRTSRTFKKYVRMYLPSREDINVHSLRHTCCIELLRNGVPIYTVQRWMRHASIRTTQKYADLLADDISKAIGEAFHNTHKI